MQKVLWILSLCLALYAYGAVSELTLIRLPPMPEAPQIDGQVTDQEWRHASTTFGGISSISGLMTARKNNFRFGYDKNFLYLAVTSEMPIPPAAPNAGGPDRVDRAAAGRGAAHVLPLPFRRRSR
jgi:hypothetical protein